jgi:hypothetical protein
VVRAVATATAATLPIILGQMAQYGKSFLPPAQKAAAEVIDGRPCFLSYQF